MPVPLLKREAERSLMLTAFDRCRRRIIESLPPYAEHGPTVASTCYVWPSSECPVGCGHCNYASPVSLGGLARYSIARDPEPIMRVLNSMGLWKAVLSGGGEPMVEPEFCELFVNQVDSPDLSEIELITSAHFAADEEGAAIQLRRLVDAWRDRPADRAAAAFTIRISLDWFHAQRIGVEPAARLITMLGRDEFADVGCYVRSVLLAADDTIPRLCAHLGGQLTEIRDYQQELNLPDGRKILVYYKNLIVEGRMNQRKLSRLPIGLPGESDAAVFERRFMDANGRHVPARVYNGPQVRHLEGLACLVEDNGMVRILEGSDPSRSASVRDFADWPEAVRFLYADPLTVYLVDNGPHALAELMADAFPDSVRIAADTNQLYHLTELLLATPDRRLYATVKVLESHIAEGRVAADGSLLEDANALFDEHGIGAAGRD